MAESVWEALAEFQKNLPTIGYDSVNPHFKNRFATLQKITGIVLPKLNELGVTYSSGGKFVDGSFVFESKLTHVKSGTEIVSQLPMAVSDPQKVGSAITYYRRYSLSAMLSILTDEDDDANAAMPAKEVKPPEGWRTAITKAKSMDALNVVYEKANGEGWATPVVMQALTKRKGELNEQSANSAKA